MKRSFKRSTLAAFISLAIYPAAADTPHHLIHLSNEIANQYTGKGVKLGVVDSGFILDHKNLQNANITSVSYVLRNPLPGGYIDVFNPDEYAIEIEEDEDGIETLVYSQHGGAVAGIINATPDHANRYQGGIAQNTQLYVTSFESANPSVESEKEYEQFMINTDSATIYNRLRFATAINKLKERSVFAINNSWNEDPIGNTEEEIDTFYKSHLTGNEARQNILVTAIKNAIRQKQILFTFAAGNESSKQPGIAALLPRYLPELEKHYLSVVATDNQNRLEAYSNRCGVSQFWCIAAPGTFDVVAMSGANEQPYPLLISEIEEQSGTSFATPVITGSLALLKERFRYFTPSQVRDTLLTTATDLGAPGVDPTYGWGLVNIQKGIQGPAQLLNDEVYTVTQNDTWQNDLNANQHKLVKRGEKTLNLAGKNHLNQVAIEQGRLNLNGTTQVNQIQNNAELGITNKLSTHLVASPDSTTYLAPKAHWIMQRDTQLGHVSMEKGSQITLNPQHRQANGSATTTAFNTLTIANNLTGSGQFNFLTQVENWQGDQVLVNGTATGDFKLAVENTGKEPKDSQQLSLLRLTQPHLAHAVQVSLATPVDLGAYRYALRNDNHNYRLYNPRKEQELAEAKLKAEEERQRQEAARKAEEERQRQEAAKKAEEERQRQEAARKAEEERQRQDAAKKAEEERQRQEAARKAEEERQRQEAAKKAEEERQRQEAAKKAEEERQRQEAARKAEEERQRQEAARKAEEESKKVVSKGESTQSPDLPEAHIAKGQSLTHDDKPTQGALSTPEMANVTHKGESTQSPDLPEAHIAKGQSLTHDDKPTQGALSTPEMANITHKGESTQSPDLPEAHIAKGQSLTHDDKPSQSALISRYANTALSDLSALVNIHSLLQQGRSLDRQLFNHVENLALWSNVEGHTGQFRSDNYRQYDQRSRLTEVGATFAVTPQLNLGAIVSESRSTVDFDQQASGRGKWRMLSLFAKNQFDNGLVAQADLGWGKANSKLNVDQIEARVNRHIFTAGMTLGYDLNLADVLIQPSAGVRYHRLQGSDYSLNQARIKIDDLHLVTYQAGVNVAKNLQLGQLRLTPSLASYYVDTANKAQQVWVNQIALNQQFGRYFNHEIALATAYQNWELAVRAGLKTGKELRKQRYWGVQFGYRW